MSRAILTTVRRIVYDNLGVTDQALGYGNLISNQRYLSGYIDDAIAQADIWITKLLFINKQDNLLRELYSTSVITSGDTIPQNYGIVEISYDDGLGVFKRAQEIDFDTYERLAENGIYTAYILGYYTIQDSKLYGLNGANDFSLTYIDLTHPSTLSTLKSPAGFESVLSSVASAILLMKRNDNPSQAQFYLNIVREFLQQYMLPENNVPQMVDIISQ